jgi:hypothetical protein
MNPCRLFQPVGTKMTLQLVKLFNLIQFLEDIIYSVKCNKVVISYHPFSWHGSIIGLENSNTCDCRQSLTYPDGDLVIADIMTLNFHAWLILNIFTERSGTNTKSKGMTSKVDPSIWMTLNSRLPILVTT